MSEAVDPSDPFLIETRGLCRDFDQVHAVQGLDLRVKGGEIYGFLGPNGAGKTTTIRMLSGLLRPSKGEIRIGGHDAATEAHRIRRLTGYLPDTVPLYEYLTGRQFFSFLTSLYEIPAHVRDSEAERLLGMLDLADRADDLCKGYSHGMRKKLYLAAVIATHPKLLLLDEPTSGLDPRSARRLKDLLIAMRGTGTTIFLSTHLLPTAEEVCDRVGILSGGRLLAEGSMDQLRSLRGERSLEEIFLRLTEEATTEDALPASS